MKRFDDLQVLLAADSARMRVLAMVANLRLPDCWVGAGFVRSCVWDHLHGRHRSPLPADIDVIWHDPRQPAATRDRELEHILTGLDGTLAWSVKNQARMHVRNGDAPYCDATDAMRFWPETATAVAVRLSESGTIEVAAPFGLDDLFGMTVRPTARFADARHALYGERMQAKRWRDSWPLLTFKCFDRLENP